VDIVGTTTGETILEPGVNLINALGNDGVGVGFSAEITCETIPSGSGTWNDMTPPRDRGDVLTDEQKGL